MTQAAAMLPDPESTTFHSVAHPHRTGEYDSGALGRETPYLHGLETSRDGRGMNNPGLKLTESAHFAMQDTAL